MWFIPHSADIQDLTLVVIGFCVRFLHVLYSFTALVDPGRIEVPLYAVDPDEMLRAAKKSTYGTPFSSVF